MATETIDEQPSGLPGASRSNGGVLAGATPTTNEGANAFEMTKLRERIEQLERQHGRLKWDSLLIAGVTTVAVALIVSMMLLPRSVPQAEGQLTVRPRTLSAQSFVLTDPDGKPRARFTIE